MGKYIAIVCLAAITASVATVAVMRLFTGDSSPAIAGGVGGAVAGVVAMSAGGNRDKEKKAASGEENA